MLICEETVDTKLLEHCGYLITLCLGRVATMYLGIVLLSSYANQAAYTPPPPPQAPVASASTWPVPLCSAVWNRSHQPAAGAGPLHCRANHTGDPLVTVISHIHTCIHTHILHTHTHTPGLLQLCPVGSSLWSCPGNLKKLPHHSKTKLVEICNPRSN